MTRVVPMGFLAARVEAGRTSRTSYYHVFFSIVDYKRTETLTNGLGIDKDRLPMSLWCAGFVQFVEVHPSEYMDIYRPTPLICLFMKPHGPTVKYRFALWIVKWVNRFIQLIHANAFNSSAPFLTVFEHRLGMGEVKISCPQKPPVSYDNNILVNKRLWSRKSTCSKVSSSVPIVSPSFKIPSLNNSSRNL